MRGRLYYIISQYRLHCISISRSAGTFAVAARKEACYLIHSPEKWRPCKLAAPPPPARTRCLPDRRKPDVLRPDIVEMRGSTVIPLRPSTKWAPSSRVCFRKKKKTFTERAQCACPLSRTRGFKHCAGMGSPGQIRQPRSHAKNGATNEPTKKQRRVRRIVYYTQCSWRGEGRGHILRRMGKNKALAHHTSTYFHTRRVSI